MHFNNSNLSTTFKERTCTVVSAVIFVILFMAGLLFEFIFWYALSFGKRSSIFQDALHIHFGCIDVSL